MGSCSDCLTTPLRSQSHLLSSLSRSLCLSMYFVFSRLLSTETIIFLWRFRIASSWKLAKVSTYGLGKNQAEMKKIKLSRMPR